MMDTKQLNKIVISSSLGTLFEWYDFLIFGTAAALVFNNLFFPSFDPAAGMIASLLTYIIGFFARPVGGAIFGHLSDTMGRKTVSVITMAIMGVSTVAIGFLPTYEQVGILAPILLVILRICQGIGFGGEWGSAILLVVETCPKDKRGFYSSFMQVGFPLAIVLSAASFSLINMLPPEQVMEWGWRLPFIGSILLVAVSIYIRTQIAETVVFKHIQDNDMLSKNPMRDLFSHNFGKLLIAVGVKVTEVSWSYLITIFMVAYATKMGWPKSQILNFITIAAIINLVAIPFFGYLSDRVGRKTLIYAGSIFTISMAFPIFWLLSSGNSFFVAFAIIIGLVLGNGMMFSAMGAYLAEIFEPQIRSTGLSVSNQLAAAIGGGLTPIFAVLLSDYFSGTNAISVMMITFATITLISNSKARIHND